MMTVKRIVHSKPTLSKKEEAALRRVVAGSYLSQGPQIAAFEEKMSGYLGVKGAVAVNSGTAALHLALLALGVGPSDQVIIPSYVCTALLNAVLYCGAEPCVVDVNLEDMNISIEDVRRKLHRRTKAIIVPHMFGMPADLKPLIKLGVPILEDCAQSIGAEYAGKKAGSYGAVSVCSFYATKVMTTGEGGMVCSNNRKLLDTVRDLRSYDHPSSYRLRYNYKLTDLQAAVGLVQLSRLDGFIARRRAVATAYQRVFKDLAVDGPEDFIQRRPIFYRYVLRLRRSAESFLRRLSADGIDVARPVFKPIHVYLGLRGFPNTVRLMEEAVSIPIYPSMSPQDIARVASAVSLHLSHLS